MTDNNRKKILLVEDEIITSNAQSAMLKKNGYDVVTASSGMEAVHLAGSVRDLSLLLADINLGEGIDGTETARIIQGFMDIPVIFLTSHTGKDVVENAGKVQRYGYVLKSSGDHVLLSSIETAIDLHNRMRSIATAVPVGIGMAREDHIVDINEAFCEMTGYSKSELLNKSTRMFYLTDENYQFVKELKYKQMTENGTGSIENVWRKKDGSQIDVILNFTPVNRGDFSRGITFTALDITGRKRLEDNLKQYNNELESINEEFQSTLEELEVANEELVETNRSLITSEERYRSIVENTHGGIMIINDRAVVTFVNRGISEILGLPREDIINRKFDTLIGSADGYRAFTQSTADRGKGETLPVHEITVTRNDGASRICEARFSSYTDGDGRIFTVVLLLDITDRKEAEWELVRTIQQLEEAVKRANRLAVEAESANRAKSQFLANMSHEIRTPINGVIGMLSLLLDTELNPMQKKYAEIAASSSETLLTIINEILDLSKIESEKFQLESYDFDLAKVIQGVVEMLSLKAERKSVALLAEIDEDVPRQLKGDSVRIKQIITNLAHNAVKFTEKGGVSIHVSREAESGRDVSLLFAVRDTGIGIREQDIKVLFEPFTQADSAMSRKYGGAGLGLAISKKFSEIMGGSIELESIPGKGSVFYFRVKVEKQVVTETKVMTDEHIVYENFDRSSIRVLLVEDNETNRHVALAILNKLGYRSDYAADGYECIEALRKTDYDLVLMDCQMPGMDGYEAAESIRSGKSGVLNPDIIIIALTAHAMEGDRYHCLESGMNDYLSKPVKRKTMDGVIVKWLAGYKKNSNA